MLSPTSSNQAIERRCADSKNQSCGDLQSAFCFGIISNDNNSLTSDPKVETPSKSTERDKCNPNHRVRFSSRLVTAVKTRPRTRTEEKPNLYWTANEIASIRSHHQCEEEQEDCSKDIDSSGYFRCRSEGRDYHDVSIRLPLETEDDSWKGSRALLQDREDIENMSSEHAVKSAEIISSRPTFSTIDDEENGPHLLGLLPLL